MDRSRIMALVLVAMAVLAGIALLTSRRKDVSNDRKRENFARDVWLLGSLDNLKESFGQSD